MLDLNQFDWWRQHATKYIGAVLTIIGTALAMGLIPPQYIRYADLAVAVLGGGAVKRGFTNNALAAPDPMAKPPAK